MNCPSPLLDRLGFNERSIAAADDAVLDHDVIGDVDQDSYAIRNARGGYAEEGNDAEFSSNVFDGEFPPAARDFRDFYERFVAAVTNRFLLIPTN